MSTLLVLPSPRVDARQPSLANRPLKFQALPPGRPCPVTRGRDEIVPHLDYTFGSAAMWFGDGPVYVNLAWKADRRPGREHVVILGDWDDHCEGGLLRIANRYA